MKSFFLNCPDSTDHQHTHKTISHSLNFRTVMFFSMPNMASAERTALEAAHAEIEWLSNELHERDAQLEGLEARMTTIREENKFLRAQDRKREQWVGELEARLSQAEEEHDEEGEAERCVGPTNHKGRTSPSPPISPAQLENRRTLLARKADCAWQVRLDQVQTLLEEFKGMQVRASTIFASHVDQLTARQEALQSAIVQLRADLPLPCRTHHQEHVSAAETRPADTTQTEMSRRLLEIAGGLLGV